MVGEGTRNNETIAAESLALIPVEANLEIPPLFQMRRTDPTNRLAECRVPVAVTKSERLEQYWRISVPEPYELPGTFDQDTWVAVQTLVNMRGGMSTDGKLSFSMYELLEIMGKPDNGQSYKELRESLQRLSATYIYSENAFYSKDIEKFETRGFNLWDIHFSQTRNKKLGRASERHTLEFHSVVRRSFQAEYLKTLDKDFYYSLSSRLAKRLYRLIDRKRRDDLIWSVPLERLKQLLPLSESYRYPSKIKTVLKAAHCELREKGFLIETSYEKAKTPAVRYRVSNEFVRRRSWPKWAIETDFELPDTLPLSAGPSDGPPSSFLAGDDHDENSLGADSTEVRDTGEPERLQPPVADAGAEAVWDPLLGALSQQITSPSLLVWFEGTVPTAFEDSTLVLQVPNRVALEYIETRFGELIRRMLKEQVGPDAELLVQAPDSTGSADYARSK